MPSVVRLLQCQTQVVSMKYFSFRYKHKITHNHTHTGKHTHTAYIQRLECVSPQHIHNNPLLAQMNLLCRMVWCLHFQTEAFNIRFKPFGAVQNSPGYAISSTMAHLKGLKHFGPDETVRLIFR